VHIVLGSLKTSATPQRKQQKKLFDRKGAGRKQGLADQGKGIKNRTAAVQKRKAGGNDNPVLDRKRREKERLNQKNAGLQVKNSEEYQGREAAEKGKET